MPRQVLPSRLREGSTGAKAALDGYNGDNTGCQSFPKTFDGKLDKDSVDDHWASSRAYRLLYDRLKDIPSCGSKSEVLLYYTIPTLS